MAVSFSGSWADEISPITGSAEFQNCEITISNPNNVSGGVYDVLTDTWGEVTDTGEVYSGPARFIPVRSGTTLSGDDQANATTIRGVRFQIPASELGLVIGRGFIVTLDTVPGNVSLEGRTAVVSDDFQGSATGTRTFHAMMDADSGLS